MYPEGFQDDDGNDIDEEKSRNKYEMKQEIHASMPRGSPQYTKNAAMAPGGLLLGCLQRAFYLSFQFFRKFRIIPQQVFYRISSLPKPGLTITEPRA